MATLTGIYESVADEALAAYASRTYSAVKVETGLYLQVADDSKTVFAVGKFQDGAAHGLDGDTFPEWFDFWTWGRVDKAELDRLTAIGDDERLIEFIRDSANYGGWYRTKRDALAAALATQEA